MKRNINKNEFLLILVITIYMLATTMVTTFANVYILDYTNSLTTISIYSICRYGFMGISALLAAKLSTRIRMYFNLIIGVVSVIGAVLLLLAINAQIKEFPSLIYLIGLLWGFGEGFCWISFNTLIQVLTRIESRGTFLGIHGALTSIATIIAPILSTFILSFYTIADDAYLMMFRVAIAFYIIVFIIALNLKTEHESLRQPFTLHGILQQAKTDIGWRYVLYSQFIWGIRDAALVSLAGLLIYQAIHDSSLYSQWLSLFALLATLINYIVGKTVNTKRIMAYLTIGSLGIFTSGMIIIFFQTPVGAFLYGFIQNGTLAFISTPYAIVAMNVVGKYHQHENIIRRTLTREMITALARSIGLLFVVVLNSILDPDIGIKVAVFLIYFFCIIFLFIQYHFKKKKPELFQLHK